VSRDLGVEVKVIHNASVMNAVGACGLQLYRFGQTVSIVFFTDTWRYRPRSLSCSCGLQLGEPHPKRSERRAART